MRDFRIMFFSDAADLLALGDTYTLILAKGQIYALGDGSEGNLG